MPRDEFSFLFYIFWMKSVESIIAICTMLHRAYFSLISFAFSVFWA